MKKKVLFIIGTLQSGGVSKSIVNLLNAFDRERFDVALFIVSTGGVFEQFLPSDVRIIRNADVSGVTGGPRSAWRLLKRGRILLALAVVVRLLLSPFSKSLMGRWMAWAMPCVSQEEWDLIVDYGGQQQLYYMVDKLKGKKKITFFHNDYSKWPYYYKADRLYYPKVDGIYTISETCADALRRYFPDCADKVGVIENISSPALIRKMAEEKVALPQSPVVLATLGHFCRRKGSDFAIEAAKILVEKNVDFSWLFIGQIKEPDLLEQVKAAGLQERFVFTGIQANPYPYVAACNVYVHPARFEGKSIALDEAKILCKPIVVTRFSTVNDQFEEGVNASFSDMNGEALAQTILDLLNSEETRNRYTTYLQTHLHDNTDEVLANFYRLLD